MALKKLWQAADKLRGHMDAAEYKYVVLGLVVLKYISDAFDERYNALKNDPFGDHNAYTFHSDLHRELEADYILANPSFNISD